MIEIYVVCVAFFAVASAFALVTERRVGLPRKTFASRLKTWKSASVQLAVAQVSSPLYDGAHRFDRRPLYADDPPRLDERQLVQYPTVPINGRASNVEDAQGLKNSLHCPCGHVIAFHNSCGCAGVTLRDEPCACTTSDLAALDAGIESFGGSRVVLSSPIYRSA